MLTFESSILETIKIRRSVRSYNNTLVDSDVLDQLLSFASDHVTGPFGNTIRFQLVDADGFNPSSMKSLGTYGAIKGAKSYLVGISRPAEHIDEDFGCCMETAILKATSLGLGTCWLGGYLNRSTFAELCHIAPEEIIASVTPLGYASPRTTLRDKMIRKAVDGNQRRPFNTLFFAEDFTKQLSYDEANPYHVLLEAVRLAPSASNKQPWRILLTDKALHLYLDEDFPYNNRFEHVHMQNIDMGIAMAHITWAAQAIGLLGKWEICTNVPAHEKFTYITTWTKQAVSQ